MSFEKVKTAEERSIMLRALPQEIIDKLTPLSESERRYVMLDIQRRFCRYCGGDAPCNCMRVE